MCVRHVFCGHKLTRPFGYEGRRIVRRRNENGFTLIEIAIVLVIIGLLLGGVLKGQELIQSARVRNLISQQDGIKAAYFGFLDRYRALPGDYGQASTNIACTPVCTNGNNNGQITASGVAGATIDEHIAVWEHLTKSGFIHGNYTFNPGAPTTASAPTNPYAQFLQMIYDDVYAGTATARHNLKTGNQISSTILAEVDRKVDDGIATTGSFRASTYTTGAATDVGCFDAGTGAWAVQSPASNCGGASLF
jgi:prepilin-type N-terminal cleavage/methylation domain-containing protein